MIENLKRKAAAGGETLPSALFSVDPIDRRIFFGVLCLSSQPVYERPVLYRKPFRLILNLDGLAC